MACVYGEDILLPTHRVKFAIEVAGVILQVVVYAQVLLCKVGIKPIIRTYTGNCLISKTIRAQG